ncbi:MAG: PAS domain S-box protein, partial [Candidatus Pacearchaeota archaeon]|nr:PAS domain S-box protein [Candidatus Pacearchaeota archaeon]
MLEQRKKAFAACNRICVNMKKSENCNSGENLKHALNMLHTLFDGIDEIIYVIDPETNKVLFANDKTKHLFGENVEGKKCYSVFHKLSKPCQFCTNAKLFGKTPEPCLREIQNLKNKHWYKCIDKAVQWPGNKFVRFGIAIDVTKRKKIEDALLKSEKRYRSLIKTAPVVIYTLSLDGKITSLNPKFEEFTGWSRKEWLGKPFDALIHPDDLPLAIETYQRILRGEKLPSYELRIRSKSGEYLVGEFTSVPIIENGKILGEFGVVQDITERKSIENALKESEELFRSIVENSHDTILIIDDAFRIIYANAEITKNGGCSKEELVGQDFRKFLDEESRALVEERYLGRQNGESVPSQYEFRIVRKNGEKRDVRVKSTIIKDRHG